MFLYIDEGGRRPPTVVGDGMLLTQQQLAIGTLMVIDTFLNEPSSHPRIYADTQAQDLCRGSHLLICSGDESVSASASSSSLSLPSLPLTTAMSPDEEGDEASEAL